MLLGAHESVAGGLHRAFDRCARDGCEAVQIWVRSSRAWAARPLGPEDISAFRAAHARHRVPAGARAATGPARPRTTGPIPTAAHASYLINLAAGSSAVYERSTEALYDECARAELLGVAQVIVHPGAASG